MLKRDHVLLLKTCFLSQARYPSGSKYRCGSALGQLLHDEHGLQFVRLGPARARKLKSSFLSSPVVQDGTRHLSVSMRTLLGLFIFLAAVVVVDGTLHDYFQRTQPSSVDTGHSYRRRLLATTNVLI